MFDRTHPGGKNTGVFFWTVKIGGAAETVCPEKRAYSELLRALKRARAALPDPAKGYVLSRAKQRTAGGPIRPVRVSIRQSPRKAMRYVHDAMTDVLWPVGVMPEQVVKGAEPSYS
jgi:hypothetical protein